MELPDFDDKSHAELVEEARAAIPSLHPGWTDHNPSDPGIALVELLAWLTEMLIYRTGRIPDESVRTFLRLLDGKPRPEGAPVSLDEATHATLGALRERWRAVTPEDYEYLAMHHWPRSVDAKASTAAELHLSRVLCLPERDLSLPLSNPNRSKPAPGHVSVIVVQGKDKDLLPWTTPRDEFLSALTLFFQSRRLIGTRVHVLGPDYTGFWLSASIYLKDDARPQEVKLELNKLLDAYFDPRTGGREGTGWPFGRDVHVSDIYARLDGVRGVEFVEDLQIETSGDMPLEWKKFDGNGRAIGLRIDPHALPRHHSISNAFTFKERRGSTWEVIP
jgi:hypothetical protein